MLNKHFSQANVITWKQYAHQGYSAFASMGRQIRIGVLSVATLGTVAPVLAAETVAKTRIEVSDDEKELDNFKKRKYQYMAKDKDGRDVFLADSGYVLQMAQQDFEHIKFHFTSEF